MITAPRHLRRLNWCLSAPPIVCWLWCLLAPSIVSWLTPSIIHFLLMNYWLTPPVITLLCSWLHLTPSIIALLCNWLPPPIVNLSCRSLLLSPVDSDLWFLLHIAFEVPAPSVVSLCVLGLRSAPWVVLFFLKVIAPAVVAILRWGFNIVPSTVAMLVALIAQIIPTLIWLVLGGIPRDVGVTSENTSQFASGRTYFHCILGVHCQVDIAILL